MSLVTRSILVTVPVSVGVTINDDGTYTIDAANTDDSWADDAYLYYDEAAEEDPDPSASGWNYGDRPADQVLIDAWDLVGEVLYRYFSETSQ